MAASSRSSPSAIPDFLQEIITEILLRLPPKSLLKCKCVSKSWLHLISSHDFVNTHLKLAVNDKKNRLHRVLFRTADNFQVHCVSSLFCKEGPNNTQVENNPFGWTVDTVNGLICVFDREQGFIWNPSIGKSKKLPSLVQKRKRALYCKRGFGYNKSHDDYKVVVVEHRVYLDGLNDNVVHVYSLRTDSWRTIDEFQGYILLQHISGKCINGKLYWAASAVIDGCNARNIVSLVSLDLEDETWGKLKLPNYGEGKYPCILGAVGNDLSMLCTCPQGNTCDVWIMKDCGVGISWTKMFNFKYPPQDLWGSIIDFGIEISSMMSYPGRFYLSIKGEILLWLPKVAMIYNPKDGLTKRLEVNGYEEWRALEIYVESLVDPLLIAVLG